MRVFLTVIVFAAILMLISSVFIFAPYWLPEHLRNDMEVRIGVAQLSIEVASLVALFLAAWEFRQAQKVSKLRVAIRPINSKRLFLGGEKEILITRREVHHMEILVENNGEAAARFVKVVFIFHDPERFFDFVLLSSYDKRWKYEPPRLDFSGGDDLVVYSHPKKVSDLGTWLEKIGNIGIFASNSGGFEGKKATLKCLIEAYDFPRIEQTFNFCLYSDLQEKKEG